jgi:hypothetical protein
MSVKMIYQKFNEMIMNAIKKTDSTDLERNLVTLEKRRCERLAGLMTLSLDWNQDFKSVPLFVTSLVCVRTHFV